MIYLFFHLLFEKEEKMEEHYFDLITLQTGLQIEDIRKKMENLAKSSQKAERYLHDYFLSLWRNQKPPSTEGQTHPLALSLGSGKKNVQDVLMDMPLQVRQKIVKKWKKMIAYSFPKMSLSQDVLYEQVVRDKHIHSEYNITLVRLINSFYKGSISLEDFYAQLKNSLAGMGTYQEAFLYHLVRQMTNQEAGKPIFRLFKEDFVSSSSHSEDEKDDLLIVYLHQVESTLHAIRHIRQKRSLLVRKADIYFSFCVELSIQGTNNFLVGKLIEEFVHDQELRKEILQSPYQSSIFNYLVSLFRFGLYDEYFQLKDQLRSDQSGRLSEAIRDFLPQYEKAMKPLTMEKGFCVKQESYPENQCLSCRKSLASSEASSSGRPGRKFVCSACSQPLGHYNCLLQVSASGKEVNCPSCSLSSKPESVSSLE